MKSILSFFKMWQCACILAAGCFMVAFKSRLGKASRRYATKRLQHDGKKLLQCVDAQYKISIEDPSALEKANLKIFMSNHLSLFDLPLITATLPYHIRMVIKKELLKVPFIGKAAVASEQLIVDRDKQADHSTFYSIAKEKLSSGIAVWFFPEGTRSRTGNLLAFKKGGFKLAREIEAQIIPVGIIGTNKIIPPGKLMPNLKQSVKIKVGTPIQVKKHDEIDLLIENVFMQIKKLSSDNFFK